MEIEALKIIASQGGGVVGVMAVAILFLRHLSRQSTDFTDALNSSQTSHIAQMDRLIDDHVTLTKETVTAVQHLDATVRSVERTVRGVEATVSELKTVVTLMSLDRQREERARKSDSNPTGLG